MRLRLTTLCAVWLWLGAVAPAQSHYFTVNGLEHRYLLHVPEGVKNAPLLIILHGYAGEPENLFDAWQEIADLNEFVVVALKSAEQGWSRDKDGVDTFEALLYSVRSSVAFDERRIYLYGYSNGGRHAARMALLWSNRVAAAVAMAAFTEPITQIGITAERRVPILILAAEHDMVAPVTAIHTSFETFRSAGHDVQYQEIKSVGHSYGRKAAEVHRLAWRFLRQHRLPK